MFFYGCCSFISVKLCLLLLLVQIVSVIFIMTLGFFLSYTSYDVWSSSVESSIWSFAVMVYVLIQEAQLSQRDRAMLGVIEYFAKSLKVIVCCTVS